MTQEQAIKAWPMVRAFAEGKQIEFLDDALGWITTNHPDFDRISYLRLSTSPEPAREVGDGMRVCKTCGLPESEHHDPDWIEVPDGCVCAIGEWDGAVIPQPCAEYVGNGKTNCERCEHDKKCHRPKLTPYDGGAMCELRRQL